MLEQMAEIAQLLVDKTGFMQLSWKHCVMILVGLFFVYLAIVAVMQRIGDITLNHLMDNLDSKSNK